MQKREKKPTYSQLAEAKLDFIRMFLPCEYDDDIPIDEYVRKECCMWQDTVEKFDTDIAYHDEMIDSYRAQWEHEMYKAHVFNDLIKIVYDAILYA